MESNRKRGNTLPNLLYYSTKTRCIIVSQAPQPGGINSHTTARRLGNRTHTHIHTATPHRILEMRTSASRPAPAPAKRHTRWAQLIEQKDNWMCIMLSVFPKPNPEGKGRASTQTLSQGFSGMILFSSASPSFPCFWGGMPFFLLCFALLPD